MVTVLAREDVTSWGGVLRLPHTVAAPGWPDELAEVLTAKTPVLACGLRRSYGDSCLNPAGTLVDMTGLNRVMAFDPENGVLRAEAGASLHELMALVLPHGWFFATTPGTRFVTLGGAVANDVHGKNHHRAGTFGCHVKALGLLRSDRQGVQTLVPGDALFAATVGGLGLTGLMAWVEVQLVKVPGAWLSVRRRAFAGWEDFWQMAAASKAEHTVAWVDSLRREGRGIFEEADWLAGDLPDAADWRRRGRMAIPFTLPVTPLNRGTVKAFNALYYHAKRHGPKAEDLRRFFYPLDAIGHWPRLYGRRGFYQYQCVVPEATMKEALPRLMDAVAASGQASFLAVLKTFGERASPGLLSFPMAGATLALDFPNRGEKTLALLARLDALVAEAGGRLYAAKDGRLPGAMFRRHPGFAAFAAQVDPAFSSHLWERVKA